MQSVVIHLGPEPIRLEKILTAAPHPAHGAQILFTGTVRDHHLGRQVLAVSYDAFEPLAKKVLLEIAEDVRRTVGEEIRIDVYHRTGRLEVGEVSVAIAVSSPHRAEAYRASREIIEKLKVRVPIWKKEHYIDGESAWLQGHALCGNASEELHG
jgi:molybdopterin synthase catalytic subunit